MRRCGKNCQVGANPSSSPSIPIREGRAISETAARLGWSTVFSHTPCQASGHLIGAKGGYCPGVALPTGKERRWSRHSVPILASGGSRAGRYRSGKLEVLVPGKTVH